jgi:hypothetical protein
VPNRSVCGQAGEQQAYRNTRSFLKKAATSCDVTSRFSSKRAHYRSAHVHVRVLAQKSVQIKDLACTLAHQLIVISAALTVFARSSDPLHAHTHEDIFNRHPCYQQLRIPARRAKLEMVSHSRLP